MKLKINVALKMSIDTKIDHPVLLLCNYFKLIHDNFHFQNKF